MSSDAVKPALKWLADNDARIVGRLAELVKVPSISTDGRHAAELDRSADVVAAQMRDAGLTGVRVLRHGDSYPYVYGERLDAPGRPTLFLYAHHDVQPINYESQWKSDPWTLTERDGRLYGRGAADDKAAIVAHLAAVEAFVRTAGRLPVNVRVLIEGEEEVGSNHLLEFFRANPDIVKGDAVVVLDTENVRVGTPSLTYALRGVSTFRVTVEGLALPVHSGMAGGGLPDAAIGLNVLLARLCWGAGDIPIPGLYDRVRPMTGPERAAMAALPVTDEETRRHAGVLDGVKFAMPPGVSFAEATTRRPAVTVIAQEAGTYRSPSNQVLPRAEAVVSIRTVPDQRPDEVAAGLRALLTKDPPWGLRVKVEEIGKPVAPWMIDPAGPAFAEAMSAMKAGYGTEPTAIGCGGSIGFVAPLCGLLGGAPALLLGIEDPESNAHAPNESLHAGDFRKLLASLVHLFAGMGALKSVK